MAEKYLCADFTNSENQITLNEHLNQWDIGMTIDITLKGNELPFKNGKVDTSGVMLHFANKFSNKALVVKPNGDWVGTDPTDRENYVCTGTFKIPNSLLEQSTPIVAYIMLNKSSLVHYTMKTAIIIVEPRKQPNDYVSQQDYVYTLEALREEILQILETIEAERDADYQDFKNQIKQDIKNLVYDSKPEIKSYEYLTDTSVKYNGVTYTVTKDEVTGLINKITDSNDNYFKPKISSGITDVSLHNAVFWAIAMYSGKYSGTGNYAEEVLAYSKTIDEADYPNTVILINSQSEGKSTIFRISEPFNSLRVGIVSGYVKRNDLGLTIIFLDSGVKIYNGVNPNMPEYSSTTSSSTSYWAFWYSLKDLSEIYINKSANAVHPIISSKITYDKICKFNYDIKFKDVFTVSNSDITGAMVYKYGNSIYVTFYLNGTVPIMDKTNARLDHGTNTLYARIDAIEGSSSRKQFMLSSKVDLTINSISQYDTSHFNTILNDLDGNIAFNTFDLCDENGNVLLAKNCDLSFFI